MLSRVVFSSQSDHWSTPDGVYAKLHEEFGFTFDPCPLKSDKDGSKEPWHGRVFCNPPYSKIPEFMRRGLYHLASKECELIVFLVPARTDTAWFHEYCLKAAEIRFVRGRLKFGDAKFNAPFPSMVVVFREWAMPETLSFEGNGRVSVPVSQIVNSPKVQAHVQVVRKLSKAFVKWQDAVADIDKRMDAIAILPPLNRATGPEGTRQPNEPKAVKPLKAEPHEEEK